MSRQRQQPAAFVPDSFTRPAAGGGAGQAVGAPLAFDFPDLDPQAASGPQNPLLVSLNRFVPTAFETVAEHSEDGRQDLEDARRRILRQLESYKKRQEDELYQLRVAAEKEAEEQVLLARQQAADIRRQAEEQGYAEGLSRGEEKVAEQVAGLGEILQQLLSLRESLTQKYEQQLISLAVAVARKIVQREISLDPEIIFTMAKQAIAEMPHEKPMILKLHPDDYQVLKERLPAFARQFERLDELQLVPAENVPRGGCLLETPAGRVDASLDSQLAEIEAGLQG